MRRVTKFCENFTKALGRSLLEGLCEDPVALLLLAVFACLCVYFLVLGLAATDRTGPEILSINPDRHPWS